ncbi:MAG: MoxR family ATPase [Nanoarchaeota archaeon]
MEKDKVKSGKEEGNKKDSKGKFHHENKKTVEHKVHHSKPEHKVHHIHHVNNLKHQNKEETHNSNHHHSNHKHINHAPQKHNEKNIEVKHSHHVHHHPHHKQNVVDAQKEHKHAVHHHFHKEAPHKKHAHHGHVAHATHKHGVHKHPSHHEKHSNRNHMPDMDFDRKRIEERLRRIGGVVENKEDSIQEQDTQNVKQVRNKITNIVADNVNRENRRENNAERDNRRREEVEYNPKNAVNKEEEENLEIEEVEEEPKKELIKLKENFDYKQKKSDISDDRPELAQIKKYADIIAKIKSEVAKSVTGQERIVNSLIMALLCDGHVLLEGVPGIAKTLAIKTLAIVSGCSVKRIQFTVDLLPTDITGIVTYNPGKGFETLKGPIFANFVIADEINRSPSKTQSALIEAMQEMQVTIGKETYKLQRPFFVMATENPVEQAGVYQLPEAQVDRFLFKLIMGYPEYKDEIKIMEENMTLKKFEEFNIKAATSGPDILKMQALTKKIYLDDKIKKYILNIVQRTRTRDLKYGSYIEWGASPRASIALFIASKAEAFMNGRNFVIPSDVKAIAHDVLRHRIILTYRARAEHIDSDKVIDEILDRENV